MISTPEPISDRIPSAKRNFGAIGPTYVEGDFGTSPPHQSGPWPLRDDVIDCAPESPIRSEYESRRETLGGIRAHCKRLLCYAEYRPLCEGFLLSTRRWGIGRFSNSNIDQPSEFSASVPRIKKLICEYYKLIENYAAKRQTYLT